MELLPFRAFIFSLVLPVMRLVLLLRSILFLRPDFICHIISFYRVGPFFSSLRWVWRISEYSCRVTMRDKKETSRKIAQLFKELLRIVSYSPFPASSRQSSIDLSAYPDCITLEGNHRRLALASKFRNRSLRNENVVASRARAAENVARAMHNWFISTEKFISHPTCINGAHICTCAFIIDYWTRHSDIFRWYSAYVPRRRIAPRIIHVAQMVLMLWQFDRGQEQHLRIEISIVYSFVNVSFLRWMARLTADKLTNNITRIKEQPAVE